MNNRRKKSGIIPVLMTVMALLAVLILWLIVPFWANVSFGPASDSLTPTQKWIYSAKVMTEKSDLLQPGCTSNGSQKVSIEMGDSIKAILQKLADAGVIQEQNSFKDYLIYKGIDTSIRAGNYSLSCSDTPVQIAGLIENQYSQSVVFDILPGWRAEEIANALATSGINVGADEFLKVVNNPGGLTLPDYIPDGQSVEGFLFPGEYNIDRDIDAEGLVQLFVNRFSNEIQLANLNTGDENGLTFYQRIILASIIQRETYVDTERPLIASVFYNRLANGMKLETDPSVQYALGFNPKWGWWKSPLSQKDLSIHSDYNTYLINGLPPAPIANPDLSSIQAAENPASSDYFYFRAKCDNSGSHVFAATLQEQIDNACK